MTKPIITPEIVRAAMSGDAHAMKTVMHFFRSYIQTLSTRPFYDEYGNKVDLVDESVRIQLESRLMLKIMYDFDPDMVLKGEKLTED